VVRLINDPTTVEEMALAVYHYADFIEKGESSRVSKMVAAELVSWPLRINLLRGRCCTLHSGIPASSASQYVSSYRMIGRYEDGT
jgi:hypothetical protein